MASGTQGCTNQCYDFFINPFQQGWYNLRDASYGTKTHLVAHNVLVGGVTLALKTELSLAERVSKAAIGLLLIIPIVNLIVMAILKSINSKFIYTSPPQPDVQPNRPQPHPGPDVVEPPQPQPQDFGLNLEMPQRKDNAARRLTDIEAMVMGQADAFPMLVNRFECHPNLARFDLDGFLTANYATNEHPSGLFQFIDWADVQNDDSWQLQVHGDRNVYEEERRGFFETRVNEYSDENQFFQDYRLVKGLLQNIFSYFTLQRARIAPGTEQENVLKEQFRIFYKNFINANNNCVYQVISQLETFAIDIAISSNEAQEQIPLRQKIFNETCLALCKHRKELLTGILIEQDLEEARRKMERRRQAGQPVGNIEDYQEEHMANLQRIAMQELARALNLEGTLINAGARLGEIPGLRDKAIAAVDAFILQYKPEEYLLRGVAHPPENDIRAAVNRSLEEWAVGYYALADEDPDGPQLDQRLSSGEPNGWPISMGGGLTPAGTALLMQAAGLIIPFQGLRDAVIPQPRPRFDHIPLIGEVLEALV